MSAIRKVSLSAAALFIGLSALFVVTGTAAAAVNDSYSIQCDTDWQTPCP